MRKPNRPREPAKPEREDYSRVKTKNLTFGQEKAPSLAQVIEALPQGIRGPGEVAITYINHQQAWGSDDDKWILIVEYQVEQWVSDKAFREADKKFKEVKWPKYQRAMEKYNKALVDWKKDQIEKIESTC